MQENNFWNTTNNLNYITHVHPENRKSAHPVESSHNTHMNFLSLACAGGIVLITMSGQKWSHSCTPCTEWSFITIP